MKGDGEDSDFLSLGSHGSSSRSGSGSGSGSGSEGASGRAGEDFSSFRMLSSLSRNGLRMLAGGTHGGFSLRPPAVGSLASARNLAMGGAERGSKVGGGGFTGFYRASANKSGNGSSRSNLWVPGMKPRVGKGEKGEGALVAAAAAQQRGIAEHVLQADVEDLTPDECWRLILKLGSRWPAWNGTTATQAPEVTVKDRSSMKEERVQGLQLGQDSLRFLASRALEALAQTPDRPAGGMLAPKWTTQEIAKTKTPTPAANSTLRTLATLVEQPSFLAKVPVCSSQEIAFPKVASSESGTAPLTIFYAGTVNVCENVPEDKARLIMLFAEKAGILPHTQAKSAPPDASPQFVLPSKPSSDTVRPQEELQLSELSSEMAPSANRADGLTSKQRTASDTSTLEEMVPAESSPVAVKFTISEDKSRQNRQQGTAKPLPNARKNSLARFLDSRKRPTAPSSESPPRKKRAIAGGCPSDAHDIKGKSGMAAMPLCSQSSIISKENVLGCGYSDSEMRDWEVACTTARPNQY